MVSYLSGHRLKLMHMHRVTDMGDGGHGKLQRQWGLCVHQLLGLILEVLIVESRSAVFGN